MKAQKKASERNTLPNIDWNNEDHVSSPTVYKLSLYLKPHNLQVSGGQATLVAGVLRYVRAAQQILEPDNDATSDSEPQSSDSEDPDDSEDDAQSDSSEMGEFIEYSYEVLFVPDTDVECVTVHSN